MGKRHIFFALLGLALFFMIAWTVFASYPIQPARSLAVRGQLGGSVEQVAIMGDYAFAIVGPRIFTFDISDAASPTVVAKTQPLNWDIQELLIDGGRLYATSERTLLAFDIWPDGSLQLLTPIQFTGYPLLVHQSVVYLSGGSPYMSPHGLTFWDITDPHHPRYLGAYKSDWPIQGVKVLGQRLYLYMGIPNTPQDQTLAIFDISQPGAPRFISQLPPLDEAGMFRDLQVRGTQLYYLDSNHLTIFDISDETHPRQLGALPVRAGWIAGVGDGGLLLAKSYNAVLLSIDVSDPHQPMFVGETPAPGLADSWQQGTLLVVGAKDRGLQTFSLTDILQPQPQGHYRPGLVWPLGAVATSDTAYVLDANTLAVVDLTYPYRLEVRQRFSLPQQGTAIHLRGARLYVAAGDKVFIYDIQSPLSPQLLRTITFPSPVADIASMRDRLYVSVQRGPWGLYALDLEGAISPKGIIGEPLSFFEVAESQGRRFVYAASLNVRVYDITDEDAAYLVGETSLEHTMNEPGVTDVHVRGGLVFLSTGEVVDASDPAHPRLIQGSNYGQTPSMYPYQSLAQTALWGSRYYLLRGGLNVSDPALPYLEQSYPIKDYTVASLAINDEGLLIINAGPLGLWLLEYPPARFERQFWEAESGVVTPPMQVENTADACGGRNVRAVVPQEGRVDFTLEIDTNDDYYLWARVLGLDWHHNSFWVNLDGGDPFQFEIRPPDGQWHWVRVYPEHDRREPFFLTEGTHRLRFAGREAESRVDALYLTNQPGQHPSDVAPCHPPPIPTPTPPPPPTPTPIPMPTPAPPPPDAGLTRVGSFASDPFQHLSGPFAAQGDVLFAAQDDQLLIYNTHDLPAAVRLAARLTLPGPVSSLAVQDDYLFAQARGLAVVDVSDINSPRMVAYLAHLAAGDIHLDSDRLYLVDGQTWTVIDIRDPATPSVLASLHMPPGQRVQFANHRAYLQETADTVAIYDLNYPSKAEKEGVFTLPTGDYLSNIITDFRVQRHRLYLLTYTSDAATELASTVGVLIVDVAPNRPPTLRGAYTEDGWLRDVTYRFLGMALTEDRLIVGHIKSDAASYRSDYSLIKFDVSDPDHPQPIQTREVDSAFRPLFITPSRVWGRFSSRLGAFAFEDLTPLTITGNLSVRRVGGVGDDAYVWDGKRLYLVDNATPQTPTQRAIYQGVREVLSVDFQGAYAFIGQHYGPPELWHVPNQICVVNLFQGPDAPCQILPVESDEAIRVMPDPNGYVFLATTIDYPYPPRPKTYIVDVRDVDHMQVVGGVDFKPAAAAVVPGFPTYVLWAVNEHPFSHRIDIARLDAPAATIATFPVDAAIRDIALDGRTLLILTDDFLQTVDLSDPTSPRTLAALPLGDAQSQGYVLKTRPGQAVVGVGHQVRVIDVADPSHPRQTGIYTAPDTIEDIHIQPPLLILAAGRAGMINVREDLLHDTIYLPLIR